jgi:DNA processing protein
VPRDTPPTPSDAALALYAARAPRELSYASVCRLAGELAAWLGAPSAGALDPASLARRLGVPRPAAERARRAVLGSGVPVAVTATRLRERAEALGARLVTRFDDDYPAPLLDLPLPPPVLWVRGALPDLSRTRAVAVVGSRKASAEGYRAAGWFAAELAAAGVAVVSGLALGIDGAAHRAALAGPGPTVAVLGCGLDLPYPRSHERLRDDLVAAGGALVSEFRPGTPPRPWCFPVRNRLIAALATVTLVVQARERSGSLVTAGHALDLGREVWAVPGSVFDDRFGGGNALLRDGATPALSPRDLLEALRLPLPPGESMGPTEAATASAPAEPAPPTLPSRLGALARRVAETLIAAAATGSGAGDGCRDADDLSRELDAPVDRLLGVLLDLELDGRLTRLPGSRYRWKG